jgi:hypothetical protein
LLNVILVAVGTELVKNPHEKTGEKISRQDTTPNTVFQYGEKFEKGCGDFGFFHHYGDANQIIEGNCTG